MLMRKVGELVPVEFTTEDGEKVYLFFKVLSKAEKDELRMMATKVQSSQGDPQEAFDFAKLILRKSLGKVKGFEFSDGSDYVLEFDEMGLVAEDCIDDLMSHPSLLTSAVRVATMCIHGLPVSGSIMDPQGNIIEGVVVKKSLEMMNA